MNTYDGNKTNYDNRQDDVPSMAPPTYEETIGGAFDTHVPVGVPFNPTAPSTVSYTATPWEPETVVNPGLDGPLANIDFPPTTVETPTTASTPQFQGGSIFGIFFLILWTAVAGYMFMQGFTSGQAPFIFQIVSGGFVIIGAGLLIVVVKNTVRAQCANRNI